MDFDFQFRVPPPRTLTTTNPEAPPFAMLNSLMLFSKERDMSNTEIVPACAVHRMEPETTSQLPVAGRAPKFDRRALMSCSIFLRRSMRPLSDVNTPFLVSTRWPFIVELTKSILFVLSYTKTPPFTTIGAFTAPATSREIDWPSPNEAEEPGEARFPPTNVFPATPDDMAAFPDATRL
jgi:hypothetical protein